MPFFCDLYKCLCYKQDLFDLFNFESFFGRADYNKEDTVKDVVHI